MGRKVRSKKTVFTANEKYLLYLALGLMLLAFLTGCDHSQVAIARQGVPGISPTITTLPAPLSECLNGGVDIFINNAETIVCNGVNGAIGATGPQGPIGVTGPTGNQGDPGTPGQDATPVQMVQFCPGTPAYGSNFMEYGIKIGSDIYAVYSANNGFLTRLLPGNYVTTATGLNCNFTVNIDGTVSH